MTSKSARRARKRASQDIPQGQGHWQLQLRFQWVIVASFNHPASGCACEVNPRRYLRESKEQGGSRIYDTRLHCHIVPRLQHRSSTLEVMPPRLFRNEAEGIESIRIHYFLSGRFAPASTMLQPMRNMPSEAPSASRQCAQASKRSAWLVPMPRASTAIGAFQ